jgi:hypothetical protein
MLTCVNAIASLYCCIYLMHDLHHNLLGCCNYLMMQSYLCQMVCTRANGDNVLDVPKGFEGSKKATRGGEWEPIKIPRRNLAYILNQIRHPSLLT